MGARVRGEEEGEEEEGEGGFETHLPALTRNMIQRGFLMESPKLACP